MKKNNILLFLTIIIFAGVGIYLTFFSSNTRKYDSKTEAYRVNIVEKDSSDKTMYYPEYYFKVKGKEYICKSKSGSSITPNENKKTVYYDSKDPNKCLSQYESSSSRFLGIVFICATILIIVLLFKKDTKADTKINNTKDLDPATRMKIEEDIAKTQVVIGKVSIIIKRVIIGIIIFILLLLTLFDLLIVKQTIKAKDYIETTATLVGEKESDSDIFADYKYKFKDKKGKNHIIVESYSKDTNASEKIKIKYDENNPKEYYSEGQTYDSSGIIWFVVKIVAIIILTILFFSNNLLNKINISVSKK